MVYVYLVENKFELPLFVIILMVEIKGAIFVNQSTRTKVEL
jgi:uncharacterized integral membrane protein